MESDCTSGRPALIIVANCRVKMTTSRVLTPLRSEGSLTWAGATRVLTRIIRFFRMNAMTSSLVGTSSVPFRIWPLVAFFAVYSNIGMIGSPVRV